LIKLQYKKTN